MAMIVITAMICSRDAEQATVHTSAGTWQVLP